MEIDKALADDPTVYCYDELYDDMKDKEKEQYEQKLSHSKNTVEKKVGLKLYAFAECLWVIICLSNQV